MKQLTVLAFGQANQFCGGKTFVIQMELPMTIMDLRKAIHQKFPLMPANFMIAVDLTYAADTYVVANENAEIAIIPPVSGG
jgi:molybdopterin converting factor small subunit